MPKRYMEPNFTGIFLEATENDDAFHEAFALAKANTSGNLWLIGGFVFRTLISVLYGHPKPKCDFDFIADAICDEFLVPNGWDLERNHFGNPKLTSKTIDIDLVPITDIHSIVRRGLPAKIEHWMTGTPLTTQSIAYDFQTEEVIGDIGKKAIESMRIGVNNKIQAEVFAKRKKKSINRILKELSDEYNFIAE